MHRQNVSHARMIERMKSLGFKSNNGGVCQGLSMMWIQAALTGQLPLFNERLRRIGGTQDLPKKIATIQDKVKNKENLTESENRYLEILPFFYGVELYYQPHSFFELFNSVVRQTNMTKISEYTIPAMLLANEEKKEEKGEQSISKIVDCYTDLKIGNKQEIQNYFLDLKEMILELQTEKFPLPIILGCSNHAVAIQYDSAKKCWLYMDPNNMPAREASNDEIASFVMEGFEELNTTGFSAVMFTTDANPNYIKICEKMNAFRTRAAPKLKDFFTLTDKDETLATLAVYSGHAQTFKEMSKLQISLNIKSNGGTPLQFLAAGLGNFDILKTMQADGIDLNRTLLGMKVSIAATMSSNLALIPNLADIGVDFDENVKGSFPPYNPLSAAFSEKNWPGVVAVMFAKKHYSHLTDFYMENMIRPNAKAITEAFINYFQTLNVFNLNPDAIKHFAKHGVDFNLPCFENKTCLSTLVGLKRWDLVIHLLANSDSISNIQPQVLKNLRASLEEIEKALIDYLIAKKGYVTAASMLKDTALGQLFTLKNIENKLKDAEEKSENSSLFFQNELLKPVPFGLIKENDINMILNLSGRTNRAASRYINLHPTNTFIKDDVKTLFTDFSFWKLSSILQPFQSHSHQANAQALQTTSAKLVDCVCNSNCSILNKYEAYIDYFNSVSSDYINISSGQLKTFMEEAGVLDTLSDCIAGLYLAKYNRVIQPKDIKNDLPLYVKQAKEILEDEINIYRESKLEVKR